LEIDIVTNTVQHPDFTAIGQRAYWRRDALRWQADALASAVELAREMAADGDFASEDLPDFINGRALHGLLCAVAGALRTLHETIHSVVADDDSHLPMVPASENRLTEAEVELALRWAQRAAHAWNDGALDEAFLDAVSGAMVRAGLGDREGSR
jgi:hypothetical protein